MEKEEFEWSCFASQQGAEKALKALFYHLHGDPWGHSLLALVQGLPKDVRAEVTPAVSLKERQPTITRSAMQRTHWIMQSPSLRSANPKFASRNQILSLARKTAARIAARHPEVRRVILFGSFARGDFGARSDMDLLIVLRSSDVPIRDRIADFLDACSGYPTDVFPLTEAEHESRLQEGDAFWVQVMREGVECYGRRHS